MFSMRLSVLPPCCCQQRKQSWKGDIFDKEVFLKGADIFSKKLRFCNHEMSAVEWLISLVRTPPTPSNEPCSALRAPLVANDK